MAVDRKRAWLLDRLRCPVCAGTSFDKSDTGVSCESCGRRYPYRDHALDMLPDELRERYQADAGPVSDHAYDKISMDLISGAERSGGMVLDCGSGNRAVRHPHLVHRIARLPT